MTEESIRDATCCDRCGAKGRLFALPNPLDRKRDILLCPDCMYDVWSAVSMWNKDVKE